jgi:hypothetical protein
MSLHEPSFPKMLQPAATLFELPPPAGLIARRLIYEHPTLPLFCLSQTFARKG